MFGLTPFNRDLRTRGTERSNYTLKEFVDDFFRDDFLPTRNIKYDTFKVDVIEEEKRFLIKADLPGVLKENISLNYDQGLITIGVEVSNEEVEDEKNYVHRERIFSSMKRTLNLGDLDFENIDAELVNGVLKITAPKSPIIDTNKQIAIK